MYFVRQYYVRIMTFADRSDAGKLLAGRLEKYRSEAVIFALPRGGVETAAEIALALDAPLGLVIARKIGHPSAPEYAVGAVTETGPAVWNEAERASLDDTWAQQAEAAERSEAKRRRELYLQGRQPVSAANKTAIVVDDGIATGLTMQAAMQELKKQEPKQIIVAVPVAPQDSIDLLMEDANEIVVLDNPEDFLGAVAAHYENFPQLNDDEVIDILERFEA